MWRSLVAVPLMIVLAETAYLSAAEGAKWTSSGPEAPSAVSMAVDGEVPSRIWAGARDTLWFSFDSGRRFTAYPTPDSLRPEEIHSLPGSGDVVVVHFARPGERRSGPLYRKDASSWTWEELPIGEPVQIVRVAVAESISVVYAVTTTKVLRLSVDGGRRWETVADSSVAAPLDDIVDLVVGPLRSRVLLASTSTGMARSADGGKTWLEDGGALPGGMTLSADPAGSGVVVASTEQRLFRSEDWGATWMELHALPFEPRAQRAVVAGGMVFVAAFDGVWRSIDGGLSWTPLGQPLGRACESEPLLVGAPSDRDVLLYACHELPLSVAESEDGGTSWEERRGTALSVSLDVLEDPSHAGRLLATGEDAVYASPDRGASWRVLTREVRSQLALSPHDPALWLAAADEGIGRSLDGGETWVVDRSAFASSAVTDLAFDAFDPRLVLATAGDGLWRSEDAGVTWIEVATLPPSASPRGLHPDPRKPGRWFVESESYAVLVSEDFGMTWTPANGGLAAYPLGFQWIADVEYDPSSPGLVYLGGRVGVYQGSGSPEDTWDLSSAGLPMVICDRFLGCSGVESVAASSTRPHCLFAAVSQPHFVVWSGLWDETVFGIYRSFDGGSTWHRFPSDGLPRSPRFASVRVSRDGRWLIAGYVDGSVWVFPLSELTETPRRVNGRLSPP